MRRQKGFTLVELLVVIAIIAILAGAVLIAINPQSLLQKSRDATRLSDMDTLVRAINLALADGEITLNAAATGPFTSTSGRAVDGTTGYVRFTTPTGKTGLAKYLPALPADPLNTGTNVYTFQSTATNFELNTVLESADNVVKASADGGNSATVYEVGTSLTIISGS